MLHFTPVGIPVFRRSAMWIVFLFMAVFGITNAFVTIQERRTMSCSSGRRIHTRFGSKNNHLFSTALTSSAPEESTFLGGGGEINDASKTFAGTQTLTKQQQRRQLIRQEGGPLSFNTKFGALNPFAIYYGATSIVLGLPWFAALTMYQLFQCITFGRFDKLRRIPIHLNQLWGETLMFLTRCFPVVENRDILKKFYNERRPAMFVANHNSWMDIPFLGASIGWTNYKLISKAELAKVPILGKAIKVGGHILVSRDDPRSQIKTLKQGIQLLKDGVHLCTYPEGTRTRTGRLSKFKNGAFKMAHKAGAPVIPVTIVGADRVMPAHWMFPYRPARGVAKVVIHEPIESLGKSEEALAAEVRKSMIAGLPMDQRPLDEEE